MLIRVQMRVRRSCVTGTYTPSRGWTPTNTSPICSPTIANDPAEPPVPAVLGGRVDMSVVRVLIR